MLFGGAGESSDALDVYEDDIVDIKPREKIAATSQATRCSSA
jgi:hypothetical protein